MMIHALVYFTLVVGVVGGIITPTISLAELTLPIPDAEQKAVSAESQSAPEVSTQAAVQPAVSEATASTETVRSPKLLWEKKLAKALTSSAISKDGTKIAIADETGYLTVYNEKGEKLWDYHYEGKLPKRTLDFKAAKADTALLNVKFSSNGRYIICDLGVLNTWNNYYGFGSYEYYEPHEKLCFDDTGKLLWQTFRKGEHVVGGDKYVLIRPFHSEDEEVKMLDYYVLGINGQLLFTGKTTGEFILSRGFSEDAKYLFIDNMIIECADWHTVWKFEEQHGAVFRQIFKNFSIVFTEEFSWIYDMFTREKVLDMGDPSFVSITDNYAVGLERIRRFGYLRIFEIKTGHIVWSHKYNLDDIPGNQKFLYLTKDEKHLLLGSEKGMSLYDIKGRKLGELPVEVKPNSEFNYYSVTENGELILFGYEKTVRLYKGF